MIWISESLPVPTPHWEEFSLALHAVGQTLQAFYESSHGINE